MYFGSIDLMAGITPTQQMMKEKSTLHTASGHGVGMLFGAY